MALGLFVTACNNNKTGKNQNSNNKEKDDYSKSDNRNNNDEKKNEENNGSNVNNNNNSMMSGWPQVERDAFITNCVTNAIAGGTITRPVAQNYCDCMLNKMETLYPDIQDVAKLTQEDLESPAMEKMAKECLKGN